MRSQWTIALIGVTGFIAVLFGGIRVLPKYLVGGVRNEALRDCQNLVQSHFGYGAIPAPAERHDGQFEVFTWTNITGQAPKENDAMPGQTATCKFDLQSHRVVYIGFN